MARITVTVAGFIIALTYGAFATCVPRSVNQPKCVASTFKSILPSGATLESVKAVPDGGSYGEGASNIAYPTNPTNLPELCAVIIKVVSSSTSSYRFGLFLPTPANWKGNFMAVGNGGFAGGINWLDMAPGPHYGMASASTDTGHNSSTADLLWAYNHPESRNDWGWRAMHGTVTLGKRVTAAYYGSSIKFSYYNGCSTGGRQGLKEVQISPDSFDGVLVGAPAWNTAQGNTYVVKLATYNLPVTDPKHIPYTLFSPLADEVVRQCDSVDGVGDGIVSAPDKCSFDFSKIQCGNAGVNASTCLTAPQIETAKKVYSDYLNATDGQWLFSGMTLSSEDLWWLYLYDTKPAAFGLDYVRYFLYNDPNWDWTTYNDSVMADAERVDPGQSSAIKYDISAFKKRGGKMIMYHGLADAIVPTRSSRVYYNRTISTFGGLEHTTDFFRHFEVPGMQHCYSTVVDAPWNFAGADQPGTLAPDQWSVPGYHDASHDAVLALQGWVEKGVAVDQLIATTWKSSQDPSSGVLRQRPICPWPKTAVYDEKGDVNAAASWSCK